MRECRLTTTLVDVEASLFGTEVFGMRVCEFIGACELFADSDSLAYAVRRLPLDGIRFGFPIGERRFLACLGIVAFSVANDEDRFFVAADALENIGDVGKPDGVEGDCCDRSLDAVRVSRSRCRT